MNDAASLRIDDRPPASRPAGRLDLSRLLGGWINTDRGESGGVLRFELAERDGKLVAKATGAGDPGYEWAETEATPLAQTVADGHAWAFNCTFEFGGEAATEVAGYTKQGIMIAAIYTSFDDEGTRADYWTREFFHREDAR